MEHEVRTVRYVECWVSVSHVYMKTCWGNIVRRHYIIRQIRPLKVQGTWLSRVYKLVKQHNPSISALDNTRQLNGISQWSPFVSRIVLLPIGLTFRVRRRHLLAHIWDSGRHHTDNRASVTGTLHLSGPVTSSYNLEPWWVSSLILCVCVRVSQGLDGPS